MRHPGPGENLGEVPRRRFDFALLRLAGGFSSSAPFRPWRCAGKFALQPAFLADRREPPRRETFGRVVGGPPVPRWQLGMDGAPKAVMIVHNVGVLERQNGGPMEEPRRAIRPQANPGRRHWAFAGLGEGKARYARFIAGRSGNRTPPREVDLVRGARGVFERAGDFAWLFEQDRKSGSNAAEIQEESRPFGEAASHGWPILQPRRREPPSKFSRVGARGPEGLRIRNHLCLWAARAHKMRPK